MRRTFAAVVAAAAAAASAAVMAAPAAAGWTPPVAVSAPTSIELLGPQVASSASGAAAVSFNEVNIDAQANASAFLALAPRRGVFSAAQAVPGAQEVLALAYSGSTLALLTASGPPGQPCCSTVQVIRRGRGSRFGRRQTLVKGVGGGATGRLVPLANGRLLAVIAGPQGLWATEARGAGRFGALRELTRPGFAPGALAAAAVADGGSTLVWTPGSARSVMAASAGPRATPSRPRTLITVATGHVIDGLQLAARPASLTLGWTESWNDAAGRYHAQAMAADLAGGGRPGPRLLSGRGEVASALVLTSDSGGGEVAAWAVCAPSSLACTLDSRVRPREAAATRPKAKKHVRTRWFRSATDLGQIDPGQSPSASMAPAGKALIGWISGGRVALAMKRPRASRFGVPRRVSGDLADNLALGFGPTGQAIATWTQGTAAPEVFVSVWR